MHTQAREYRGRTPVGVLARFRQIHEDLVPDVSENVQVKDEPSWGHVVQRVLVPREPTKGLLAHASVDVVEVGIVVWIAVVLAVFVGVEVVSPVEFIHSHVPCHVQPKLAGLFAVLLIRRIGRRW